MKGKRGRRGGCRGEEERFWEVRKDGKWEEKTRDGGGWEGGREGEEGVPASISPHRKCVWFKCKLESLFTGCLCVCECVQYIEQHGQPVSKSFLFSNGFACLRIRT